MHWLFVCMLLCHFAFILFGAYHLLWMFLIMLRFFMHLFRGFMLFRLIFMLNQWLRFLMNWNFMRSFIFINWLFYWRRLFVCSLIDFLRLGIGRMLLMFSLNNYFFLSWAFMNRSRFIWVLWWMVVMSHKISQLNLISLSHFMGFVFNLNRGLLFFVWYLFLFHWSCCSFKLLFFLIMLLLWSWLLGRRNMCRFRLRSFNWMRCN